MTTGRRTGVSTAKADILEAARDLFAEVGYDRATIRAIAARAGVDIALVSYYYGNKKGLFRQVMRMPVDPEKVFTEALAGPREEFGERLLRAALEVWEGAETAPGFQTLLRAAVDQGDGETSAFGEFLSSVVMPTLIDHAGVGLDTGRVLASTMFGLAFMRYLIKSPIFTALTVDELVALYGPAVQRIVDADGS